MVKRRVTRRRDEELDEDPDEDPDEDRGPGRGGVGSKREMGRTIRLLGEPAILDAAGVSQPVRGHQVWALLARVLLTSTPLDRRALAAELFPETADPLGALRWCLASVRKALDCSDCLTGDPIEAKLPDDIAVDVLRLDRDVFDVEAAADLLDGIEPRCSHAFATWLLIERARVAGIVDARIRKDVIRALAVGDHDRAVRRALAGVRRNPYDEGCHILLVKALAQSGQPEAALRHVETTEAAFLRELGERPSPALRSAARRTVASPPGGIAPGAFAASLIESGLAALAAGAADAGIDCLRRAAGEAETLKDAQLFARATLELGTSLVHARRGYDEEGAILLRQCIERARQAGCAGIAAAALRELGYVDALAGRRPAAAASLAEAAGLAEDRDSLAGIHAVAGFNLVDWGRVGEGLEQYGAALEHARAAGNRRRETWALGLGAWGLLAAGRLDEADAWLGDCLTLIEAQRWMAFRPWPVALLGESRLRRGRPPEALRPPLEEAFALSCQLGDPCWEAAVARTLALTYAAADDLDRAAEWLGEARRRCVRHTDGYAALQVEILANQVEVARRQGHAAVADALARDWVALAARTHMDAHVARAAATLARADARH